MRSIYLIPLSITVLLITGCSVSETSSDRTGSTNTVSEINDIQDVDVTEKIDVLHLDLIEITDYTPFYRLSFHKVDGNTGELLPFDGNTDVSQNIAAIPENVSIKPSGAAWDMSCWFDGNETPTDTITLQFWNRSNEDSCIIIIDGLEYTVELPEKDYQIITLGQEIVFDKIQIILDTAEVYPNALLLKLSGVDSDHWQSAFLISKDGTTSNAPIGVAYEEDTDEMALLYLFEDGIPSKELIFEIKGNSLNEAGNICETYPLILE